MGSLADVAVYNYALSAARVQAHYSSGTNAMAALDIQTSTNQLILNWPSGGVLQSAAQLPGPFSDVTNATPPYAVTPTGQQMFYRLRVGP